MTDLPVVLMMGGHSAEREVSLRSGAAVKQALMNLGHDVEVVEDIKALKQWSPDSVSLVFNILHGADGEDGRLAAWLEAEGYRSTCVNFTAACVSWHKDLAKRVVTAAGLLTPESQLLKTPSDLNVSGAGPWIVKPATEGSSVGLFKAEDQRSLKQHIVAAFEVCDEVLVEDFITGTECTVGVVGDTVLPVVEIVPADGLYDYHAKYQSQQTAYHCPARMPAAWQQALQKDALAACEAINIRGWCRVDFIVDETGRRWFLEVNTTPGMTAASLLPKAAAAQGWEFDQLVEAIINTADNNSANGVNQGGEHE